MVEAGDLSTREAVWRRVAREIRDFLTARCFNDVHGITTPLNVFLTNLSVLCAASVLTKDDQFGVGVLIAGIKSECGDNLASAHAVLNPFCS